MVHEHLLSGPLQLQHLVGGEQGAGSRGPRAHPREDRHLLQLVGVRQVDLQQKPVTLRLGQVVDTVGFDGILRGQHQERFGKGETPAADAHLSFGHRLQQSGLHLGRCAVDLVGQDDVAEYRPQFDVEGLRRRPPHPGPEDVGGHQVRGELQTTKCAAHHRRHGAHRERLGDARHALQQNVPTGKQADEQPLQHPVLAYHNMFDLEQRALHQCAGRRRALGCAHGRKFITGTRKSP
jgi:hypothetical protein